MTIKDLKQIEELLDRKGFATKDDLANFATKDDLANFATKDDLANFATKDDLKNFPTKKDLNDIVENYANVLKDFISTSAVSRTEFNDLEHRVTKLEDN